MKRLQQKSIADIWPAIARESAEGTSVIFYSVGGSFPVLMGGGNWEPFEKESGALASIRLAGAQEAENLEEKIREMLEGASSFDDISERVRQIGAKLETLTSVIERTEVKVEEIAKRLERIGPQQPSIWVPITSFDPEPHRILRPMTAVVYSTNEEFEAGIFDINVYSTGDTEAEAVENLKSLLLDLYDQLSEQTEEELGPGPIRQKRFLSRHISTS